MATRTDRLVLELTTTGDGRIKASLAGVEQNLGRVSKEGERTNSMLGQMRTLLGAIAVGASIAFVRNQLNMASALGDTASMLSVNVEQLQEYHHIGRQVGITQETINNSLRRFMRRAAEAAQGGGPMAKTVENLGFALTDANGRILDAETLLDNFAAALRRVDDPAEQLRHAFAAFDTDGGIMLNMLRRNREELDQWRREVREQGGILSEADIQRAAALSNELNNLTHAWGVKLTQAVIAAEPVISAGVGLLERSAAGLRSVLDGLSKPENRTNEGLIQRDMDRLRRDQMQLIDQMHEARASGRTALAEQLLLDINDINEELILLQSRLNELQGRKPVAPIVISKGGDTDAASSTRALTDAEERFLDTLLREEAAVKRFNQAWAQLLRIRQEVGEGALSDEQLQAAGAELARLFRRDLDSIRDDGVNVFERDLVRAVENWGEAFTDTLAQMVTRGKFEFRTLVDSIELDLARIMIRQQITKPFLEMFGEAFGGALAGSGAAATKSTGGPVGAGRPYLVGEMGPELFVPGKSGTVVPSGQFGGSNVQVVQHFDFRGAGAESVATLRAEAERIKRETVGEVFRQIERGGTAARAVGRR